MTTLISAATGNLTAAGTWGVVDATSFLNSESGNTALTTSYVESSSFTPGAITIDGIAVKIASRSASPTNKVYVRIAQGGSLVAGTEVSINVSDLPLCTTSDLAGGWVFFKFASPVTLIAATAYTVSAKTDDAAMVNLFRNATSNNWSRCLRTTTTGAPAAGDDMIIIGEHTGAGTGNDITVTMNQTAATDYGSNTSSFVTPAMAIGKRGTLTYGTTAATNYVLQLSGSCVVYANGTLSIGTTGTPVPRGGSSTLQFDPTADDSCGLLVRNLGTLNGQGLSRTSGKNVVFAKLAADAAANATSLNVTGYDTGWLDNDYIAVASTTQSNSQGEKGQLNGNASSTTLTVDGFAGTGGGLLNAHGGTAPIVAEVILLTRNVVIKSISSTLMASATFEPASIVDLDWVEFEHIGASSGVHANTTTGTLTVNYCSFHDMDGLAFATSASTAFTLQDCVFYNSGSGCVSIGNNTALFTISNICVITTAAGNGFFCSGATGTISNIYVSGAFTDGIRISDATAGVSVAFGSISNLTAHSNRGIGITAPLFTGTVGGTNTSWRNQGVGFGSWNTNAGMVQEWASLTVFGNATTNISMGNNTRGRLTINNLVSGGDTTYATTNGFLLGSCIMEIVVNTGDMSTVSGVLTAHTNDVNVTASALQAVDMYLNNVKMGGTNQVAMGALGFAPGHGVHATRLGQVDGVSKSWFGMGSIETDATTYHTAAPSAKMTPTSATWNLDLPMVSVVNDGDTLTFAAWVQKNGSYNGSAPSLVLKGNAATGQTETVLDSLSVGSGTWEQLSGQTSASLQDGAIEVVVRVNGTAGAVYVDDGSVTTP